jgi:diguanylate cyclase (GGDEF)-like protein
MKIEEVDNSNYIIHVVDDSRAIVASLTNVLEKEKYSVVASSNGEEALCKIAENVPDLIILDVEMPVMDGYETMKRLQQNTKTVSIPVIFHTAITEPEVIKKLFKIGASDYISKPFISEELLARVSKEIRNINLQNRLKEKMSKLAELVSTDSVTKTSNKFHMTSIINSKLKILETYDRDSFSLMYVDIDNFNSFSKINGIIKTDGTLKKFSLLLKKCIREKDILSHWEGDVFVIYFPQISQEELNEIAHKIRTKLEKAPFASNDQLTCSISIFEVNKVDSINNIIGILSQRVHKAKRIHKGSIVTNDEKILLKQT